MGEARAAAAAGRKAVDGPDAATTDDAELGRILWKVSWLLLPLLLATGLCNTLDRTNGAYAALELNTALGLSPSQYGRAAGVFFITYGGLMLPSTFATMVCGARVWYSAITVAWGAVATCHAWITAPWQLYLLRLLLGATEAGSVASAWHLLAQFYPRERLTRPYAVMALCHIVGGLIAAPLAAGLLSLHGRGGLYGYQWLFIVEGVASIACGLAMAVWLPSGPLSARFLTQAEAQFLHVQVHGSHAAAEAATQLSWRQLPALIADVFRKPTMFWLTLIGCLWAVTSVALMSWLPTIVANQLAGTALHNSSSSGGGESVQATLLSAVPHALGLLATPLLAWHSQRSQETTKHFAILFIAGGILLGCFAPLQRAATVGGLAALSAGLVAVFAGQPIMTSRVAAELQARHSGVGLSIFQAPITLLGGFAGPAAVGDVVERSGSFASATILLGACLVGAGLMGLLLACWEARQRRPKRMVAAAIC